MTAEENERAAALAAKRAALAELQAEVAALANEVEGPPVSPLAPAAFPDLRPVAGVRLAAACTGLKYRGRDDVMLAEIAPGTSMAGCFTRSATRSAPVLWCEDRIAAGLPADRPLGIVVNAGNANAFTGGHGAASVRQVMAQAATALGTVPEAMFMASTGVIGVPLPAEKLTAKLGDLVAGLSPEGLHPAAKAIMTTDTFPKGAGAAVNLDGAEITISGFAKGSGMIAPDMATMLVFIFTDAAISAPVLQEILGGLTDRTFNAITVDSDTSTSDTLLVAATGKAEMAPITTTDDPRLTAFAEALHGVMRDLAIQVVKDGEGATKLVEITVEGAADNGAARRIGLAIANSPLVKTAIAGEDPNWGRIVMAVGKSGEAADRDRLGIRFGDIAVAEQGWVSPDYREELGAAYMKRQEIAISVDVGIGPGSATVWTCDLTKRYIEINADYRS